MIPSLNLAAAVRLLPNLWLIVSDFLFLVLLTSLFIACVTLISSVPLSLETESNSVLFLFLQLLRLCQDIKQCEGISRSCCNTAMLDIFSAYKPNFSQDENEWQNLFLSHS